MGAELKHAAALDNSVERLIASWAQSSAVVSQGFEGTWQQGLPGWGQRGRLPRSGGGLYPCEPWRACGDIKPCR